MKKKYFSWWLAFVAFSATAFCLFSFWGIGDVFCLNTGCHIYKGYKIFGVSFYLVGAFYFGALCVLALFSCSGVMLSFFTASGLLVNLFFLLYQIFFWPCTSCLMVAGILGLFAFSLFRRGKGRKLLYFWLLFFTAAGLGAIRDGVQPWSVFGKEKAEIEIFFSASCPACKQLLKGVLANPEVFEETRLYPVIKEEGELEKMFHLKKNLEEGMNPEKAFEFFWKEQPQAKLSLKDKLALKFFCIKNKMILAKMGQSGIPVVVAKRIPSLISPAESGDADILPCPVSSDGSGSCGLEGSSGFSSREW